MTIWPWLLTRDLGVAELLIPRTFLATFQAFLGVLSLVSSPLQASLLSLRTPYLMALDRAFN